VASLFGYKLPQNFNFPYLSRSFGEFWKRWHMTLGLWLKEYLYIPLGGNRKGELKNYLNLMVVMVLGGLWHGASVNYLLWGAFHGSLLVVERIFSHFIHFPKNIFIESVQILSVFTLVTLGWLFFQLDFDGFKGLTHALFHNWHVNHNRGVLLMIFFYTLPVLVYYFNHIFYGRSERYKQWVTPLMPYVYGLMCFAILFQSGNANAFIYFQF